MKISELKKIIRESIKEIQIQEGPMGAAKDCKKCLDAGECCKISGTSSNPISTCIPCGAERIDMNKGMF
tara:strand:- start:56 stop:262 length:207 start_codon:yes stop_codon:yes gene_type:complete